MAPIAVQSHCHLNAPDLKTYGAVRQVVMEYCRAQVDIGLEMPEPMDLSALGQGQGRQGRQEGHGREEGQRQGRQGQEP